MQPRHRDTDPPPYEQGREDWLAFGREANAFFSDEEGHEEYERGKRDREAEFRRA